MADREGIRDHENDISPATILNEKSFSGLSRGGSRTPAISKMELFVIVPHKHGLSDINSAHVRYHVR